MSNSARYCHKCKERPLCEKYPFFLSDLNESWIFWTDFEKKKAQISNFIKIHPVEGELFHADERKDAKKTVVDFRNFANAPKMINVRIIVRIPNIIIVNSA